MSVVKRYDCSNGGASFCQGCYTMEECELGDYISSEDYDQLAAENKRLEARLEQANKQVSSECQDWAREYEARRKAIKELHAARGLLREIAVGISKRYMPTEQQLNAWFDRIDAALSTANGEGAE